MAEAEIARVADEAFQRWPLMGLTAIHRHGLIRPGEEIVLVIAASAHRLDAFAAAEFLMDYLKTRAPFWKREHLADGTVGGWVEAKASDTDAAARWEKGPKMSQDDPTAAERYAAGMMTRRAVLGDAYVDRATSAVTDFNREFQEFITRTAWGDIWNRPGLDRRARSIVVLSTTIALRHWGEFRIHLRGALANGLSREEIKEILMQSAIYAGVPAANHAFKEAMAVFAEMDAG